LSATYSASSSSECEPVCKRQVCSSTASGRPDLGRVDPEHVVGVHVNAATVGFIPFDAPDDDSRGQFAAVEAPDLLVDDVRSFFRTVGRG
jgi:hypothetical protein